MRVLVIGGSGLVGRPTARELARRGHTVSVLTRRGAGGPPGTEAFAGDVTTGVGPAAATRRLGELGQAAGVRHHVVLGIVNSDRVGSWRRTPSCAVPRSAGGY